MTDYRNIVVGINGDGNAVGNNNQITVKKTEKHVHHHHNKGGGGGSGGGGSGEWVWGLGIAAVVAIAAGCYYFTRYSDTIYLYLKFTAWMEALAALVATGAFWYRGGYAIATKTGVVTIAALLALLVASTAADGYPQQIVEFAIQSPTFQGFWCGLSPYGKQLSFLHMITAGFLIGPALLFLACPSFMLAFFGVAQVEVGERFYVVLERLTSWVLVAVVVTLIALAGYAHSPSGWNTWVDFIKTPPSWPLCPSHN